MTRTSSDLVVDNLKLSVRRQATAGSVALLLHGEGVAGSNWRTLPPPAISSPKLQNPSPRYL